jgi:hypothetical protein
MVLKQGTDLFQNRVTAADEIQEINCNGFAFRIHSAPLHTHIKKLQRFKIDNTGRYISPDVYRIFSSGCGRLLEEC